MREYAIEPSLLLGILQPSSTRSDSKIDEEAEKRRYD
jgi:hypothetical protein